MPLQMFLFTEQKREFFYKSGSSRNKQVKRNYECVYVSATATQLNVLIRHLQFMQLSSDLQKRQN